MADDAAAEQQSVPDGASGVPAEGVLPGPPRASAQPDSGYTTDGVPTLEGIREKIEAKYATALGATELAQETPEGRDMNERYDAIQKAAAEKLQEIRAAMAKDNGEDNGEGSGKGKPD